MVLSRTFSLLMLQVSIKTTSKRVHCVNQALLIESLEADCVRRTSWGVETELLTKLIANFPFQSTSGFVRHGVLANPHIGINFC